MIKGLVLVALDASVTNTVNEHHTTHNGLNVKRNNHYDLSNLVSGGLQRIAFDNLNLSNMVFVANEDLSAWDCTHPTESL